MEHTFKTKLVELLQRCRKAVRLYSSVSKSSAKASSEFADLQADVWRSINNELLRRLSSAMDKPSQKDLVLDVAIIRDELGLQFRSAESQLNVKQRDLIFSAENGDFVRVAILAKELVVLKARLQAAQAAHHEIAQVIHSCNIKTPTIELSAVSQPADEHSNSSDSHGSGANRQTVARSARVYQFARVGQRE